MIILFNADEGYIKVTMMTDDEIGNPMSGTWCKNWAKTPEELVAVLDANDVDVYADNLYHSSDVDDCNDYGFDFIWEAHDIINEALAIIDKRLMRCTSIPLVDRFKGVSKAKHSVVHRVRKYESLSRALALSTDLST